MPRASRRRIGPAIALALSLGFAVTAAPVSATSLRVPPAIPPTPATAPAAAGLPAWDGSIDLYRDGVFSTQRTWLWCTAAGVQIIANIVDDTEDHGRANQARYFDWMRERNRYDLPESAGVDPQGWTAGLRHFVDDRYRLQAHRTFDAALADAVTRLRLTGLPVALTVAHGGHGWVLHGFAATADPAVTDEFTVTSVRVTGPLWGRQNREYGYDMRPDTKLTVKQLRTFFTPWRYAPKAMIWDGTYVSIQPIPLEPVRVGPPRRPARAPGAMDQAMGLALR